MSDTATLVKHISEITSLDRFLAWFGNAAGATAWLLAPGTLTAIGGVTVSLATATYFVMRALHERQRMRHEEALHQRRMEETEKMECGECGHYVNKHAKTCPNCETVFEN